MSQQIYNYRGYTNTVFVECKEINKTSKLSTMRNCTESYIIRYIIIDVNIFQVVRCKKIFSLSYFKKFQTSQIYKFTNIYIYTRFY